MRPIESKERTSMRQLQNLPRHRRFHRNRPTCFAKIGAILVGRHRRCRRFNEVLQLPRPWKDFAQLAQTIRRLEAGNPIPLLVHDTIFILKSAVQRRKHLAEAKCTEEACLRRGHSPKVNPKGAQACARRGGSMDFLMESGFMHWMSERMSFTNWVKADFHETSRITLKFSAPPRLRERYRLGAGSSRYGNCFF